MTVRAQIEERIVVLAPSAHDGPVAAGVLAGAGFTCVLAGDLAELVRLLEEGAAAALVAEEALVPAQVPTFSDLLGRQEPWSDLPIILLTGGGSPPGHRLSSVEALAPFGNVTLLDRPFEVLAFLAVASAALRARRRQYAARAILAKLDATVQAQRVLEAELREADRHKTEFIGALSHELRNPLAPIRNSVFVLGHAAGGEQVERARQVIERQTAHLARLVDDLLDVTRVANGKIELRRSRVDARVVVRRTCDDHRSLFEARGIGLEVRSSRPAWVDADPTRLAQMVGNLLQNAAKFGRQGNTVLVDVTATDSVARISVRDEGVGIAPEVLPRLFEPFVQAEGGVSRSQGGLGLGLSLVKGLAELHGGTVRARSGGLGKGAEFVIELPLTTPPVETHGDPRVRAVERPLRILVIDDNQDAAQTLADVLGLEGHTTLVALNARAGLEIARKQRPDVIICDIGLPDMDGHAFARAARAEAALASSRLVALSGYAQLEDRQLALDAGFDEHLAKPAELDDLHRVLGGRAGEPVARDPA